MGSAEGAIKTAAAKAGLGVNEYLDRLNAGLKYCSPCGDWHPCSAFGADSTRWDGLSPVCRAAKNRYGRKRYKPTGRQSRKGYRYVEPRDGDKEQARGRVNKLVLSGQLPKPGDVPCVDCGHIGPGSRHEYDHHLGYAAEHHEAVEAVCAPCHHKREADRICHPK